MVLRLRARTAPAGRGSALERRWGAWNRGPGLGAQDRTNDQETGSQGGGVAADALMGPGDLGSEVGNPLSRESAGRWDGSEAVWGGGWGE